MSSKFFLACMVFSSAASADVLYSNIGSGFPADSLGDYSAGATFFGTTFTATATGNLITLELDAKTSVSPVTVGLYTSSADEPGTLLESWSAALSVGSGFPAPAITSLTSLLNPLLSSGTQYWIVYTQTAPNQVIWYSGDESVPGGIWAGTTLSALGNSFPTFNAPGIELDSAATPEPASAMLLALGIGSLLLAKKMMVRPIFPKP